MLFRRHHTTDLCPCVIIYEGFFGPFRLPSGQGAVFIGSPRGRQGPSYPSLLCGLRWYHKHLFYFPPSRSGARWPSAPRDGGRVTCAARGDAGPRERKLSVRRKRAREAAGPIKADEAGGGRSDRARAAAAAPGEPGGTARCLRGWAGGRAPGRGSRSRPLPGSGGPAAEAALSRCSRPALHRGPARLPAPRRAQAAALPAPSSLELGPALARDNAGGSPQARAPPRGPFPGCAFGQAFVEPALRSGPSCASGQGALCLGPLELLWLLPNPEEASGWPVRGRWVGTVKRCSGVGGERL